MLCASRTARSLSGRAPVPHRARRLPSAVDPVRRRATRSGFPAAWCRCPGEQVEPGARGRQEWPPRARVRPRARTRGFPWPRRLAWRVGARSRAQTSLLSGDLATAWRRQAIASGASAAAAGRERLPITTCGVRQLRNDLVGRLPEQNVGGLVGGNLTRGHRCRVSGKLPHQLRGERFPHEPVEPRADCAVWRTAARHFVHMTGGGSHIMRRSLARSVSPPCSAIPRRPASTGLAADRQEGLARKKKDARAMATNVRTRGASFP